MICAIGWHSWVFAERVEPCRVKLRCENCTLVKYKDDHDFRNDVYLSEETCATHRACIKCNKVDVSFLGSAVHFVSGEVKHKWSEWDFVRQDSCRQERVCSRCKEMEDRVRHDYPYYGLMGYDYVKEGSCVTGIKCRRCENINYGPKNHMWGDPEYKLSYSCEKTHICLRCNAVEDYTEHQWSSGKNKSLDTLYDIALLKLLHNTFHSDAYSDVISLQARWHDYMSEWRRYGDNNNLRNEKYKIISGLDDVSLKINNQPFLEVVRTISISEDAEGVSFLADSLSGRPLVYCSRCGDTNVIDTASNNNNNIPRLNS